MQPTWLPRAIKKATVLAYKELGMEAIYEFEVEDMPGNGGGGQQRRFCASKRAEEMGQTHTEKVNKVIIYHNRNS